MKAVFDGVSDRRSPDRPELADAEQRALRTVRIGKQKALNVLTRHHDANRARDEADAADALRMIAPTPPVNKPAGSRTGRPDPARQAAINVTARYHEEKQKVAAPFERQEAAILAKARARQPQQDLRDAGDDMPAGGRLEPREITPAYIGRVEALTRQEDGEAAAKGNPIRWPDQPESEFPANWPDQPESDFPMNWPRGSARQDAIRAAKAAQADRSDDRGQSRED